MGAGRSLRCFKIEASLHGDNRTLSWESSVQDAGILCKEWDHGQRIVTVLQQVLGYYNG